MNSKDDCLRRALFEADFARADELLRGGADINARNDYGESLLQDVISPIHDRAELLAITRFMLEHGANPRLITPDGGGPLFSAVIRQDTGLLRLLLDHGADPNLEHDLGESLYDWAEFDYRYETYDLNLPDEPTEAQKASEEEWLLFLDNLALKYGKRRPDYLILLRERGALTSAEQRARAGNADP